MTRPPTYRNLPEAIRAGVFVGAVLPRAYLAGAYLSDAYLAGANLGGSDLTGVNLTNADLRGVCLAGAELTDADLTGAKVNEWTLLPDDCGWRVPQRGTSGTRTVERVTT